MNKREPRNSSDSIPDNKEIDYFFGIGELVKFDIRMVCIKPVTKLSTRPIGTPPTLFHTGKFFNYYDALKECENRDGVVFIPKTMEENDLWITFAKNTHKSARISEAFYPKTYYHEIKRFLWADCSEGKGKKLSSCYHFTSSYQHNLNHIPYAFHYSYLLIISDLIFFINNML
ncbi:hypothetical protein Avbf_17126 [Armadillidium vulgare]|nr:hypothetical protein Avbf_17126 [Armadillidium vulgare]